MKWCSKCGFKLSKKNTSPLKRGFLKITSRCKFCQMENFRLNYQKYRWPILLGKLKKVPGFHADSDDETITPLFLKKLYSRSRCDYCNRLITKYNRRIDFKVPLFRNGKFSSWNISIICTKCKNKKGSKTLEEMHK